MSAPAPPAASFSSVDEAMDMARASLGYLARADVASLPGVVQARLLRELERAQSQHTAGRAKVLTAFTVQGGYADDGHGGPHPWLAWQTRVTAKAASGSIGWMRRLGAHPRIAAALPPECLAAVTEVLDTLGKKAGPEDDRSAGQRRHDALEEAMRLLLASGCLPERAGQAAQVQLHLTLEELLDMPGGTGAASAWLARHLAANGSASDTDPADPHASGPAASQPGSGCQPGGGTDPGDPHPGHTGTSQPGGGLASGRPDLDELLGPDPRDAFTKARPRAARRAAARAGQPGWLTGKAAEAYSCDAKIAPMVCGPLDRNALARDVTDALAGDLANLVT